MRIRPVIGVFVLSLVFVNAQSVDFTDQVLQDGRSVYSNIPAECVRDGVLICLQYHPLNQLHFNHSRAPASATVARPTPKTSRTRVIRQSPAAAASASQATAANAQLSVLEQLVEMNRILDEHFPGAGSAQDRARVKQQQSQIMNILNTVEGVASEDAKPTIRRAIEIFQSGISQ